VEIASIGVRQRSIVEKKKNLDDFLEEEGVQKRNVEINY
jgi:hypothetical protein